jgi:hypothetical protein
MSDTTDCTKVIADAVEDINAKARKIAGPVLSGEMLDSMPTAIEIIKYLVITWREVK